MPQIIPEKTTKRLPRAVAMSEYDSLNDDFLTEYDLLNLDFSLDEEPKRNAKEVEVPAKEVGWEDGEKPAEFPPKEWWDLEESATTTRKETTAATERPKTVRDVRDRQMHLDPNLEGNRTETESGTAEGGRGCECGPGMARGGRGPGPGEGVAPTCAQQHRPDHPETADTKFNARSFDQQPAKFESDRQKDRRRRRGREKWCQG